MDERACEFSFANTFLWAKHYNIEYTIINDMLVFHTMDSGAFTFPVGDGDVKAVINILMDYCKENGFEFSLRSVTEKMFDQLSELFPDMFEITYDRDAADYLYETEKLINLSGKKYHGKRNHINRFKEDYKDWSYERISDSNMEECIHMANEWRIESGCEDDEEKYAEFCVTLNYLKYFKELGVFGGLIRANNEVVAFSIGEPIGSDTFVVHIEKAYSRVQGAYPIINQQFAQDCAANYPYINREEDLGSEGLRKAKLSYRPIMLVEKGVVTVKK